MTEWAMLLGITPWPPAPDGLFWIALTLIGGAVLGEGASRGLGLPRVAGYAAAGMAVATVGLNLGGGRLEGVPRLVVDLGLGLLLFELGSRVHLRWLRRNPALLLTSLFESAASFAAVVGVLLFLDFDGHFAVACAAITVTGSGAVVGRVAAELKTAGQVTERMILLTALNTLYAVLTLKVVTGWIHLDAHADWMRGVTLPLYTLAGSIVLATLLCVAVAWVLRRMLIADENTVLMLLGLILLAVTAARMFGLSTLLVPLLAGVMLRNTSERPCIWPRHFGTAGGVLVLMLFVVVGSSWSVPAVIEGAFVALAVMVARWLAKAFVLVAAARLSGSQERQGLGLALALSPISATTLVLLADLQSTHPELAAQLVPVVSVAILAMAIIGPIAVQWGLQLACEQQRPEMLASRGRP